MKTYPTSTLTVNHYLRHLNRANVLSDVCLEWENRLGYSDGESAYSQSAALGIHSTNYPYVKYTGSNRCKNS